jgi:hypothetical protein
MIVTDRTDLPEVPPLRLLALGAGLGWVTIRFDPGIMPALILDPLDANERKGG